MKALVTGATGFLGANLVRKLLKEGLIVKVFIRKTSNTIALEGLDIEKSFGDILDRDAIAKALIGCNVVFHTAGIVSLGILDKSAKEMMWNVNVKGTLNLLEESFKAGIEKVIYTSTVSTVGIRNGKPSDETVPFNMGHLGIDYINSKYQAEVEAQKYLKNGLPLIIVNPSYMFGPWDIKPTSGRMILDIAKGKKFCYPTGGNNFVDVEDVADGHFLAFKNGKIEERYILGGQNLTYKEIFEKIAHIVRVKSPGIKILYPLAMGISYLYEYGSRYITKKEPMITSSIAKMGFINHYFNSQKAIKELKFPQTPIEESIKKAFCWFKKYKYL